MLNEPTIEKLNEMKLGAMELVALNDGAFRRPLGD